MTMVTDRFGSCWHRASTLGLVISTTWQRTNLLHTHQQRRCQENTLLWLRPTYSDFFSYERLLERPTAVAHCGVRWMWMGSGCGLGFPPCSALAYLPKHIKSQHAVSRPRMSHFRDDASISYESSVVFVHVVRPFAQRPVPHPLHAIPVD